MATKTIPSIKKTVTKKTVLLKKQATVTKKVDSPKLVFSPEPTLASTRVHEKDTGSSAVQIIQLTILISKLSLHLRKNPKDIVTRRCLLKKVAARKRLERYATKHKIPFPVFKKK